MRTWTLALLAVALLAAGAGIHALITDGSEPPPAPGPVATGGPTVDSDRPAPPPRAEPSAPPDAEAAPEAPREAPSLGGGGKAPTRTEAVVAEITKQALDEEARSTLRLEAMALSKSRRNPAAASIRWGALAKSAETTEERVEALTYLARAQAGSGNHLEAADSYRTLLKLPAEKEYQHHGHQLQLGVALYNAKDVRGALTELDRLRGDANVSPVTIAGASWVRVQCLDALGDLDDARAAAADLVAKFKLVPGAQYSVKQAELRLLKSN